MTNTLLATPATTAASPLPWADDYAVLPFVALAIGGFLVLLGASEAFKATPASGTGLNGQLAAAEARREKAWGWLVLALALPFLAGAFGGLIAAAGGGIAAVIGGFFAWAEVSDAYAEEEGLKVAQAEHGAAVHAAQAQVSAPDPTAFDPHGMGIAAPRQAAPAMPSEPTLSKVDAQRWGRFGSAIDFPPGSAAAAIFDADGGTSHAQKLWAEVAVQANLGAQEERVNFFSGAKTVFVPAADLLRVEPVMPAGDARLVVQPRDLKVGANELARVIPCLLRLGRIRAAGNWERDHVSDTFSLVLTNRDPAAEKAAPKPASDGEWV